MEFNTCLVLELLLLPSNAQTAPNLLSLKGNRWQGVISAVWMPAITLETGFKTPFCPREKLSYKRFVLICDPYTGKFAWFGSWGNLSYRQFILITDLLISGFWCSSFCTRFPLLHLLERIPRVFYCSTLPSHPSHSDNEKWDNRKYMDRYRKEIWYTQFRLYGLQIYGLYVYMVNFWSVPNGIGFHTAKKSD